MARCLLCVRVRCADCRRETKRHRRAVVVKAPFGQCRHCGGELTDQRIDTPELRHARAMKAGEAARMAFEEARRSRGERYETKGDAYQAGYRQGYYTAMRWWKTRPVPAQKRVAS